MPFSEESGSTAQDVSGYGNDGTISGASWTASGKYGYGLSFDGTNDYVNITHASEIQPAEFTISLWAKPANVDAGARALIGKETAYLIRQDTDDLVFYVYDGSDYSPSLSASNVLASDTWIHVATVATETTQRLYINGTETSNSPLTHTYAPTGSNNLYIGVWASPEYFNGTIDEVYIYDRALSPLEIATLAGEEYTPDAPNLVTIDVSDTWDYLYDGDFIGFFYAVATTAFLSQTIGVAVVSMIFFAALYLRTKSLMLMAILWLLLGTFLIALMPEVALLAIVFVMLGIGGLLYRLFRPSNS